MSGDAAGTASGPVLRRGVRPRPPLPPRRRRFGFGRAFPLESPTGWFAPTESAWAGSADPSADSSACCETGESSWELSSDEWLCGSPSK